MVRARISLLMVFLALAAPAWAQGPLTAGVPAQGSLSDPMEEDVWSFSGVDAGDTLILAIRSLGPSGFVPDFHLRSPSGNAGLAGFTSTSLVSRVPVNEGGTYTLRMSLNQFSVPSGSYEVQLLKVPGTFVVPAGDQGGLLSTGVTVSGTAPAADPDPWTFTACAGATPRVLLSEVPPNPSNLFNPGFFLFDPAGALVESGVSFDVVDITTLPLQASGTYTLVVYGANNGNTGAANYSLTVTGTCASLPVPVGNSDTYSTNVNTPITVPAPGVLANDTSSGGSPLTATLSVPPQHGSLNLAASGGFTYTPVNGYTGTDTFSYFPVNANGVGSLTTVYLQVNAVATAQPASGLFATAIAGNTVHLQWTAPAFGPAPTSYILDGGLTPGGTIASIPTGSANPVFSVVAPSGSFYLRVRTVAGAQVSGPSNEILVHVNVPVPPSAPAGLLGTASGQSLALAWKNTYGGGAPTGLVLDVSGSLTTSLPLPVSDVFTFQGVPSGQYTFRVRATNAAGTSGPSNAVTLSFPQACSGAPQPPANLFAYAQGTTLFLSWTPATTGGAPTNYTIDVTGAATLTLPVGAARSVSGAVGPGTYTLRVSASNACGTSGLSAPATAVVP